MHYGKGLENDSGVNEMSLRWLTCWCISQQMPIGSVVSSQLLQGTGLAASQNGNPKTMEVRGIDPRTSRMLSERSTI